MERLRQRDLDAFLEYLRELYAQRGLESFKQHVSTSVSSLVSSESATHNEVDLKKQELSSLYDPVPPNISELTELFNQYVSKHPLIDNYLQTGDGRAVKISDFLTLREFRRLEVYDAHGG